jgi:hypothetical protein
LALTQYERELAILKNLDKVKETGSVADEIVQFDVLRVPRVAFEVTRWFSILSNGNHTKVRIVIRDSNCRQIVSRNCAIVRSVSGTMMSFTVNVVASRLSVSSMVGQGKHFASHMA